MKKLLLVFYLLVSSLLFGTNVYFDYPSTNSSYASGTNGRASFNYRILTVSSYFHVDVYRTIIQYPDDTWSDNQDQQTGGWGVEKAGTYHLKGLVHVDYDMGGQSNYWMDSNILTIYITDNCSPSAPQNLSMSSNSGQNGNVRLDWSSNTEYDLSYYEIWRFMEEEESWRGWEVINTTTNNYFVDSEVFYAPGGGLYHGHYKIKAVDINNNYSNYSADVTERVEPMWKRSSISNKENNLELKLENYPNPFNPKTKIVFSVPNRVNVSLKVYDILSREVAVLASRVFSEGTYEFEFDATYLPSGTYIYNLITANKTVTKKMLLIK